MQQKQKTHQSVDRAMEILKAFLPYNRELSPIDISEKLGLHRSTVHRLLNVLTSHGFLQKNPVTRKYSLGRTSNDLAKAITISRESQIIRVAQPHISNLRMTIGENVTMEVFTRHSTFMTYRGKGPRSVQVSFRVGDRLPVSVSAASMVGAAFLPPEVLKEVLPENPDSSRLQINVQRKEFLKKLDEIRKLGIAFNREQKDDGEQAIAAPIFNNEMYPAAALVISVPAERKQFLEDPEIVALLKETAASISSDLRGLKLPGFTGERTL